MPQKIRMWEITPQSTLTEITSSEISLEERLEDWLESDISMLDPDLLVIGRQVQTAFGGQMDLLCLDSNGDSVIVELKKGRTPREVTAQALDYASWVRNLSFNEITEIAERYAKLDGSLAEAFAERFGDPLPDTLNQNHRALIVAEAMDDSTERIVRYLANLNVPINVATVQHFKAKDGREMLAEVFLVEPEQAVAKNQATSKKRQYLTQDQMREAAIQYGVGALYDKLCGGMPGFLRRSTGSTGITFQARISSGSHRAVFRLVPFESSEERGLRFYLFPYRLAEILPTPLESIASVLPEQHTEWNFWRNAPEHERDFWIGFAGYFKTDDEADRFLSLLEK